MRLVFLLALAACTRQAGSTDPMNDAGPGPDCGERVDLGHNPLDCGAERMNDGGAPVLDGGRDGAHWGPPVFCTDILAANPNAFDGPYTLYVNGDAAKPWTAHCLGMGSGAPREYLYLPEKTNLNYSRYTLDTNNAHISTAYSDVRLNPATLSVDVSDQTGATGSSTSLPLACDSGQMVSSLPFGVALSCASGAVSLASIDLHGTPFYVAPTAFQLGGSGAAGAPSYSADGQAVTLKASGAPGWLAAAGIAAPPINAAAGALALGYGPTGVTVCDATMTCPSGMLCSDSTCKLPKDAACINAWNCVSGICSCNISQCLCQ